MSYPLRLTRSPLWNRVWSCWMSSCISAPGRSVWYFIVSFISHAHARSCICMHAHTHTCMHVHAHMYALTCIYTQTHACTVLTVLTHSHTHTHTHKHNIHTHTLMLTLALYWTSTTITIAKTSCYSFMISEYANLCLFSEYSHLCLFSEYSHLCLFSESTNLCLLSEYTSLCLFPEYTNLSLFPEYTNLCLFSEYTNLCLLLPKDTDCWLFHLVSMKAFLVILGAFFGWLHRQCVVPLTRRQWKCSGCSTKSWTLSRKSWQWKQCLVTHHTPSSPARPTGRVPWNGELSAVWW